MRTFEIVAMRFLQLLCGLTLFYGFAAMISTAGLQPPNIVVWVALFAIAACTITASRSERRLLAGLWVSVAACALPLALQAASHLSAPTCPPDHPPLTQSYYCVPPGASLVLIISCVALGLSVLGALDEFRPFRRLRSAA